MLRNRSLHFVLLLFASAGTTNAAEPPGTNWHRDCTSAFAESQAQGRPILFFVTMDNCYYCEKMCRETYSDNRLLEDIERDYVLATIDPKRCPQLVRKLNVRAYPTTVIVGPDETVIDSMTGFVRPDELRMRLKAAGAKIASR
jgi:thioredoxin-related protein